MRTKYAIFMTSLKNIFLLGIKYLLILGMAGVIGTLLLTLAYSSPVNPVHKDASLEYQDSMGWAPLVNNRYTQYKSFFSSFEPGALDDSTDLIILKNSFAEGEESALLRAVDMNDYGRYWHGYVSVLRHIFYFMDYWDFLLLNSFVQLFLMGCVGYAIHKVTGKKRYLLAFFSSCVFLTPAATGMSLQYSPCFYISMLGSFFCLLKADWILQKNRRYFLFLLLGIVTCYFDFLTYPLLCFAFPFCWLLVAGENKLTAGNKIVSLFGTGISFLIGYGGFFATKWFVQAIVSKVNGWNSGVSVVSYYISEMDDQYRILHQNYSRIDTLYNNFRHFLNPIFIFVLSIWIVVFLYNFIRGRLHITAENIVFAAVILTAPAWYLIVTAHTGIHHFFTYRIYDASVLGFMLFVCSACGKQNPALYKLKDYLKRGIFLCICFVLGVGASRLAKEDLTIIECGEYTELHLHEGDLLEFEFTPAVSEIQGFSFCILTDNNVEGTIHIDIYDGPVMCEQMLIPVETYQNTNFKLQLADWKLEAGKQYMMKVHVTGNSNGIRILITPEGIKPQSEYGQFIFNQNVLENIAPLSGIVYRGHMQTVPIKLFLSVCGGTCLLALFLSMQTFVKKYLLTNN